jgi:hypothetical protein
MRGRITAAVLGACIVWAGPARAADENARVVVVGVEEGSDVAPEDVRHAVAAELGEKVVPPGEATPPGAGTLHVRSRNGLIHVEFHDARGRSIEREVTAPAEGAARVQTIALLAGNLARNEADDLTPPRTTPSPDKAEATSSVTVHLAPSDELTVRVAPRLPESGSHVEERPAPAVSAASPVPPAPAVARLAPSDEGSAQRTWGWVTMGVGAAAIGTGVVLRVMARRDASDVYAAPMLQAQANDEQAKTVQSNWALALGALAVGVGTVLELTAPSGRKSTSVAVGPAGMRVAFQW